MADPGAPIHPDLPSEQRYIDEAHECLQSAIQSAQLLVDEEHAGANRHTVRELHDLGRRLIKNRKAAEDRICFARIDREEGDPLYLGRELIQRPGGGPPAVISWHVDAAIPFYEAHPDDPQGLVRKRRFELDGTKLVAIDDEVLREFQVTPKIGAAEPPRPPRTSDALLRELERARSAEMRDIVPTIEREQFGLIRADREGVLVVQGGPGTGKTAVALHRAAWLAFNHQRELQTSGGVLVIGPNRAFMEYVAAVLPGLGLDAVAQTAVDGLVVAQDPTGRTVQSSRPDTRELAFLKGDPRMAELVARCVGQRVRPPAEPVDLTVSGVRVTLPPGLVTDVLEKAKHAGDRDRPYMEARTRFRNSMRAAADAAYGEALGSRAAIDESQMERLLNAASGPWFNALERIWPSMSAPQLVHELFTIDQRMSDAAEGVLEDSEQQALMRKEVKNVREHPWSTSDLPIVDEADALLNGGRSRVAYGYVIVDEAQDMTPMQLRMAARRARGTALTLVGDLAQTTGPWRYVNWEQVVDQLPGARGVTHGELLIGYRVPAPIMRLASGLLPRIAPDLNAVEAIRQGPDPAIERVTLEDLPIAAAVEAENLHEGDRKVGVIAPESMLQSLRAAFTDLGIQVGDIERDVLTREITLLPAQAAKGLEFDHVVVVEPAAIVREGLHGLNELYVALTRATQRLSLVHHEGLDDLLSVPDDGPARRSERPPSDEVAVGVAPVAEARPRPAVLNLGGAFSEALVFAKLLHGSQARRGTAVPYLSHLLSVCALVLDDGGSEEEAIAALLHDAAEDHGGIEAVNQIATRFGSGVAAIVALCSDPVEVADDWRTVKEAHLETLETAPAAVRRVALAEKLDNARAIVRNLREIGDEVWPRMGVDPSDLVWYFAELASLFSSAHPGAMAEELTTEVGEMLALAGVSDEGDSVADAEADSE